MITSQTLQQTFRPFILSVADADKNKYLCTDLSIS